MFNKVWHFDSENTVEWNNKKNQNLKVEYNKEIESLRKSQTGIYLK